MNSNNRREFLKTAVGAAIATATGVPTLVKAKAPYVPICDQLLPWQGLTGKTGVVGMLRYYFEETPLQNCYPPPGSTESKALLSEFFGNLSTKSMCLGLHEHSVNLKPNEDVESFDRKHFREIVRLSSKTHVSGHSVTAQSFFSWVGGHSNRLAVLNRRGPGNTIVINPADKLFVELLDTLTEQDKRRFDVLKHDDVPRGHVLLMYKGANKYDGAGVYATYTHIDGFSLCDIVLDNVDCYATLLDFTSCNNV